MKKKFDKTMEANIKNYGNEIEHLEYPDDIRRKPGMYIGGKGNRGYLNMFKEIFQNSTDELMKPSSPCTMISVYYDERIAEAIVEDNGRGIPFDKMIDMFTDEHTSSNYTKKGGEFSSGVHGIGAKVTNALSEFFSVESHILGEVRYVEFHDGITKKGVQKLKPNDKYQGTIVRFRPSVEVMGEITVSVQDILYMIKAIMPLTKIGDTVQFRGVLADGKTYDETIVNEYGLGGYLATIAPSPLINPIGCVKETNEIKADIVFTFDSTSLNENIISFANFCQVREGTHLDGFIDGLCYYFRTYMNKIFLANNKKLSIINNDIRAGLKAVVNISVLEPIFSGQAKEVFTNIEAKEFVNKLVVNSLKEWAKLNPKDLQKVCKYIKEIAEIRVKSEEGRVKLTTKYNTSSVNNLPSKYTQPVEHKGEFIIVEGDSAKGSATNVRAKYQGIMPIRGKLPNAFTTPKSKFMSNEEIAGIMMIISNGKYGYTLDPETVPWEKIIFMPDADVDGKHIRALLLRFFIMYYPTLIEAGKVYSAVPPLYSLEKGKKKIYLTERADYVRYNQQAFTKTNTIADINNKPIKPLDLGKILYDNMNYTYDMNCLCDNYAVDPLLMELIACNINLTPKKLDKVVNKVFRFMHAEVINGVTVVRGLLNCQSNTVILHQQLVDQIISTIVPYIQNNKSMYYILNGQVVSLYTFMTAFESVTSVQRYKGLGEMDANELAESTLLPEQRTLIQYTLESAKDEIEQIRYYESNKDRFLELITNVTRNDLVE